MYFIGFHISIIQENGLFLWHVFITLNRKLLNVAVPMHCKNREVNKTVKNFVLSRVLVFLLKIKPS